MGASGGGGVIELRRGCHNRGDLQRLRTHLDVWFLFGEHAGRGLDRDVPRFGARKRDHHRQLRARLDSLLRHALAQAGLRANGHPGGEVHGGVVKGLHLSHRVD